MMGNIAVVFTTWRENGNKVTYKVGEFSTRGEASVMGLRSVVHKSLAEINSGRGMKLLIESDRTGNVLFESDELTRCN